MVYTSYRKKMTKSTQVMLFSLQATAKKKKVQATYNEIVKLNQKQYKAFQLHAEERPKRQLPSYDFKTPSIKPPNTI